jgi:hypothetical protein
MYRDGELPLTGARELRPNAAERIGLLAALFSIRCRLEPLKVRFALLWIGPLQSKKEFVVRLWESG